MGDTVRDVEGDYLRAYLAEYASYKAAGLEKRAEDVARALRALGHEVPAVKERAVYAAAEPLERAVEADTAPPKKPAVKRRPRTPKGK